MLIGALADATGVPPKTLRYWEAEGLLHEPSRTDGGYRDYPNDTVERVAFIRHAQGAGLTLRQIGEIVAIRDVGDAPCAHAAELVDERLTDVKARLQELEQIRDALQDLRQRLDQLDPADCNPAAICSAMTVGTGEATSGAGRGPAASRMQPAATALRRTAASGFDVGP